MKTQFLITVLSFFLLLSCGNKDEEIITVKNRIQFGSYEANHDVYEASESFGEEPIDNNEQVIKIPVEIIGETSDKDRFFKVSLVKNEHTNMQTFKPLESTYTIAKNATKGIVPITIYRNKMVGSNMFELQLKLEETEDFKRGITEAQVFTIKYDNLLRKPFWWWILDEYLGAFQPEKYQKYLELYNEPLSNNEVRENKFKVLKKFKAVREFFVKNPQYKVSFPDVEWPV